MTIWKSHERAKNWCVVCLIWTSGSNAHNAQLRAFKIYKSHQKLEKAM